MSTYAGQEHRASADVDVEPGPVLLAGLDDGPGLAAHRARFGPLPTPALAELVALVGGAGVRGRGGAGFPFGVKLETAARGRRPCVVVNASEGEPASAKDAALGLCRPHLVLDGAVAAAVALCSASVHVVLPGDRPDVAHAWHTALAERSDPVRLRVHAADPRFVSGQARAVLELIAGRPNLPVTSWAPEAVDGLRGRPTLLSNAETWAHVGLLVHGGEERYRRHGTADEPGTTLLSVVVPGHPTRVVEAAYGSLLVDALPPSAHGHPMLVGGYHGSWATWETLSAARVSVPGLRALGVPLGAGVVLAPGLSTCPVTLTSEIVDHLAAQSARRCGPCLNGLPALAEALHRVRAGAGGPDRVEELCSLVEGRGACAHPDGTARLVRSLLRVLPERVAAHTRRSCRRCPAGEMS